MIVVYGIKTCDTCRKALKWLEAEGLPHRFHDYRQDGLDAALLDRFIDAFGAAQLFNKSSKTWRGFTEEQKTQAASGEGRALLLADPTVIKRPIFEHQGRFALGFRDAQKTELVKWTA